MTDLTHSFSSQRRSYPPPPPSIFH
ncbi:unnamed protein product [Spirodela intermedia]|uniref:Uncharacterized protein n=1 Tax=Spirodela intermedia TaxID=51605 RepID=A0A7I8K314_SPIIN|nr:unnamed protein product [Spirodela intermedia]